MKVSVQAAESSLSKLIDAALSGEEVVIEQSNKPAVKLVPLRSSTFRLGIFNGQFGEGPDFLEPMSEEDLALWEGRVEPSSP
jgi:antitoxin (DNA-binding transcriptional repressor) of toxin-antitoxin stability system